jgi:peroxiredoxin
MANPLTGNFDVVAQFGVGAVDRVLAAQHAGGTTRPVYLHSFRANIPPASAADETGVRGVAEVQVSTPTITLPPDERASRVMVHFQAMARMRPRRESTAVPETVHGELQISVDVAQIASSVDEVVEINLGAEDVEVAFVPSSGAPLSAEDRGLVAQVIGNFVKTAFEPVSVAVRVGRETTFPIRHWRFKTLPGGTPPVLALLVNLRDVVPTDGDRAGVGEVLLEAGHDFAIAVSGDFLLPLLREIIAEEVRRYDGLSISIRGRRRRRLRARYRVSVRPVEVELLDPRPPAPGVIRVRVQVEARKTSGSRLFPSSIRVTVTQDFLLRADGGEIIPGTSGPPEIRVRGFGIFNRTVGSRLSDELELHSAIETVLAEARPLVRDLLGGVDTLLEELRVSPVRVLYRAVEIRAAGILVHGALDLGPYRAVVATFTRTLLPPEPPDRPEPEWELDALDSWIPGGTPQRYRWTYASGRTIALELVEEHCFFTRVSTGRLLGLAECLWPPCQWCLEVRGTQGRLPSGAPRPVEGWACGILAGGIVDLPPSATASDVRLPIAVLDPAGEEVAQIDPWAGRRSGIRGGRGANLVVHFVGPLPEETLPALRDALAEHRDEERPVFAIAVVPQGTPRRLAPMAQQIPIAWAGDAERGWTKAFDVKETPWTFLVNSHGESVWQHAGLLDVATLRAAFDQHLTPSGPLRHLQFALSVRVDGPAPDFLFPYAANRRMALRTLRGRRVVVSFWTSWSEPSLAELSQLQKLGGQGDQPPPVVLAVNDGEEPQFAEKFLRQAGLSLPFVPDPDRRIAKAFGVSCWPTTVTIDEQGIVRRIQFGISPAAKAQSL